MFGLIPNYSLLLSCSQISSPTRDLGKRFSLPHAYALNQKKAATFPLGAREMLGNLTVVFGLSGLRIQMPTPRSSLDYTPKSEERRLYSLAMLLFSLWKSGNFLQLTTHSLARLVMESILLYWAAFNQPFSFRDFETKTYYTQSFLLLFPFFLSILSWLVFLNVYCLLICSQACLG